MHRNAWMTLLAVLAGCGGSRTDSTAGGSLAGARPSSGRGGEAITAEVVRVDTASSSVTLRPVRGGKSERTLAVSEATASALRGLRQGDRVTIVCGGEETSIPAMGAPEGGSDEAAGNGPVPPADSTGAAAPPDGPPDAALGGLEACTTVASLTRGEGESAP